MTSSTKLLRHQEPLTSHRNQAPFYSDANWPHIAPSCWTSLQESGALCWCFSDAGIPNKIASTRMKWPKLKLRVPWKRSILLSRVNRNNQRCELNDHLYNSSSWARLRSVLSPLSDRCLPLNQLFVIGRRNSTIISSQKYCKTFALLISQRQGRNGKGNLSL